MANSMATVSIFGARAVHIKETSKMDSEMDMDYGAKVTKMTSTKDSSRRTRKKATEFTHGAVETSIKVIIMLT
jgi:hypothetical protein